jgi:hypothetical protein
MIFLEVILWYAASITCEFKCHVTYRRLLLYQSLKKHGILIDLPAIHNGSIFLLASASVVQSLRIKLLSCSVSDASTCFAATGS